LQASGFGAVFDTLFYDRAKRGKILFGLNITKGSEGNSAKFLQPREIPCHERLA
jgi:hypothetical protein